MPSSLNGTGVTFNDGTTLQSGAIPAANLGSGTANSTTFLRGDRTFATVPPTPPAIEIINTQIFTASGTWTKPAVSANDTLILAVIGGGGSGAAARSGGSADGSLAAAGGGGGGVLLCSFRIGDLASTVGVTVGAGAAGVVMTIRSAIIGNTGGNSTFANLALASGGGAGGFGRDAAGTVVTANGGKEGGSAYKQGNGNSGSMSSFSGFGRDGTSATATTPIPSGFTGGGGANGNNQTTQRTQNRIGGTGRLFGNGGSGGQATGGNGVIPGGGGGGASNHNANATSGAGARGEVRCFVVRGRFSASAFFGID